MDSGGGGGGGVVPSPPYERKPDSADAMSICHIWTI